MNWLIGGCLVVIMLGIALFMYVGYREESTASGLGTRARSIACSSGVKVLLAASSRRSGVGSLAV
jgi:hypothetical protein